MEQPCCKVDSLPHLKKKGGDAYGYIRDFKLVKKYLKQGESINEKQ